VGVFPPLPAHRSETRLAGVQKQGPPIPSSQPGAMQAVRALHTPRGLRPGWRASGGAAGSLRLLRTLVASDLPQEAEIPLPDRPFGSAGTVDACSEVPASWTGTSASPCVPQHALQPGARRGAHLPAPPAPARLQPGPCQRGDRPGQVPARAQPRFRQHGHRWVICLGELRAFGVPGPGTVPVPAGLALSPAAGCFCQAGSCTLASPQISWAVIPASSAAPGPALPCAPRWTSAYSTVSAPLCPSIPPTGLMPGTVSLAVAGAPACHSAASPVLGTSRDRHRGSVVWGPT